MIDHATVERIKDAANIVEVVSEFVTLRRSGANYKGLCPFHDEKTPSFYVSPARGMCHCFSCGKGGNPIGFLMEHEQMTYPEALRWLANKYHIEIRERELTDYCMQQLQTIPSMRLFGTTEGKDAVVSFLVGDIHHLDMGTLLDRLGIAVRTGHHCAQPVMDRLGVQGVVRASFALYNTKEEIDALVSGVKRVATMF